ncbi:MAG: patatin-like phospholipase family protein [Planctomycetota bacterium]|nr:patatin-like phospholipase family protein [Planctomycetota bacterium]
MSTVSVALGGGGSRGLAHIGALQVLEEEGIEIRSVSGISAGAIAGARWCLDPNAAILALRAIEIMSSTEFRNLRLGGMMLAAASDEDNGPFQAIRSLVRRGMHLANLARRPSVIEDGVLTQLVDILVGDGQFEDCRVPLQVVALDLLGARMVTLSSGSLATAVAASSAIPGVFPPVEMDGMLLADAGAVSSVPVAAARAASPESVVLAIDPSRRLLPRQEIDTGMESLQRVATIARNWLTEIELEEADIVVRPVVGQRSWSDMTNLASIVEAGRTAMSEAMPALQEALAARQ